jgi:hypothetical protein
MQRRSENDCERQAVGISIHLIDKRKNKRREYRDGSECPAGAALTLIENDELTIRKGGA